MAKGVPACCEIMGDGIVAMAAAELIKDRRVRRSHGSNSIEINGRDETRRKETGYLARRLSGKKRDSTAPGSGEDYKWAIR